MNTKIGSFTDSGDGKVYKTIKICEQVWMAENLNVSKYRNGDPVPFVDDVDKWGLVENGACCSYENNPENEKIYGKLYN